MKIGNRRITFGYIVRKYIVFNSRIAGCRSFGLNLGFAICHDEGQEGIREGGSWDIYIDAIVIKVSMHIRKIFQ